MMTALADAIAITVSPSREADGRRAHSSRGPLFDSAVDGRTIITRSTQPLLDGARALIAEGVDPARRIVMRHAGSDVDALRSTVGAAAKLTLEEGERLPTLRPWKPSPHAAVTPPMRPIDREASKQPGALERTGESPQPQPVKAA
jgi:hypothetical protein